LPREHPAKTPKQPACTLTKDAPFKRLLSHPERKAGSSDVSHLTHRDDLDLLFFFS
jgi:hypothetical protein